MHVESDITAYNKFCVVQDLGKKKKTNLRIKGKGKETVNSLLP